MKVLLIEDDSNKATRISNFLHAAVSDLALHVERSYSTGLRRVMEETFDWILLDMSLPIYEIRAGESGFDAPSYAGEDILDEMRRKCVLGKVIVITQFETFGEGRDLTTLTQLSHRLAKRFPSLFKLTIFYSPAENTWQQELLNALSQP